MRDDRTVHGLTQLGSEIVRYEKAGAWYVEPVGQPRQKLTVRKAARYAIEGTWHEGQPGGLRFDAIIRTILAERRAAST